MASDPEDVSDVGNRTSCADNTVIWFEFTKLQPLSYGSVWTFSYVNIETRHYIFMLSAARWETLMAARDLEREQIS